MKLEMHIRPQITAADEGWLIRIHAVLLKKIVTPTYSGYRILPFSRQVELWGREAIPLVQVDIGHGHPLCVAPLTLTSIHVAGNCEKCSPLPMPAVSASSYLSNMIGRLKNCLNNWTGWEDVFSARERAKSLNEYYKTALKGPALEKKPQSWKPKSLDSVAEGDSYSKHDKEFMHALDKKVGQMMEWSKTAPWESDKVVLTPRKGNKEA